jgi:hypothetical protein
MRERANLREYGISVAELFCQAAQTSNGDHITLGDFLQGLRHRATAGLILLFALPNVFPAPPGTSTVLGFPLLILCAQFALGFSIWLPRFITRRSIKRGDFERMLENARPWLQRVELLLKPRLRLLTTYAAERMIGLLALVLSIVLVLPIPFGNMPPAAALCLLALGLLGDDGIFILIGLTVGIGSLVIAWTVVSSIAAGVFLGLTHIFT